VGKHLSDIERFTSHFAGQIQKIEAVSELPYRKMLYSAALDPLARAAYGNRGHRDRVVQLIDDLTSWPAKNLVSPPQLSLALRERKRTRYRLFRNVAQRLAQWPPGHVLKISASPSLSELQPFAATEERTTLKKCRYAELFYTYRNNLVHEFREPGYGIEMATDGNQPYYHSEIGGPWQLVFPVGFFTWLFDDALRNLQAYLTAHDRNPYEQFEFGSLWR